MRKKLLALLLAGVMSVSLLAGCGGGTPDGSSEQAKSSETESKEEEKADNQEAEGGAQEITTVKILCKNDFSASVKTADWEKYPASQKLIVDLEERGLRLELECIDNESFANVVQTRMAAGTDIPDLVAYCWLAQADVQSLAKNGQIYSINELLEQYDADGSIKTFYDEKAPGAWEKNTMEDGNVYWFSYLLNIASTVDKETGTEFKQVLPNTLSIRKDWIEAVGGEVKEVYTPEELFDLVKKMQDADVNGNGQKDEVMYIAIDGFNNMAQAYGLSSNTLVNYYQGENKVFTNFQHENFPDYIKYMQSLYDNGLIDTVALTTSQDEMISQNRAAIVSGYTRWGFEDTLPGVEPDKSYYIPILVDTDGDLTNGFCVQVDSCDPMTYCQYFVPKGAKNPEAVVRLMDYVYTEEYAVLDWYGLEGKGYELDENGNIIGITSVDEETSSLFDASVGLYALPAIGIVPCITERYSSNATFYEKEKFEWTYHFDIETYPMADKIFYSPTTLAMATDDESTFISENETVLTTYASELLVDLILGNKSLDNLPEYLDEMNGLGLQEYIDIIQARRDRVLNQ